MINADGISESSLTPYLLFAKEQVKYIKISNPDCSTIDLMKIVGGCWKNLTIENKKIYYDLFEKNIEEYNKFKSQHMANQANPPSKENSYYIDSENQRED